jgi:hypothetical protein
LGDFGEPRGSDPLRTVVREKKKKKKKKKTIAVIFNFTGLYVVFFRSSVNRYIGISRRTTAEFGRLQHLKP